MAPPETRHRLGWRLGLGIYGLALAIRALHLLLIHDAAWFDLKMGDSDFFHSWALELSGGDWIGSGVFWYAPMYPYFMGLVYAIFGEDTIWLRAVQITIGAGSAVLLAAAAARLWSRRVGIACGALVALYGPAVYFDALCHKPVLAFFFLALVLFLLASVTDAAGTARRWFGLGAALGALILTRENAMAFAILIPVWLLVHHRSLPWVRRALLLGAFAGGIALIVAPVAIRNKVVGGELHLTAANFGDNFYKGNNPKATGAYVSLRPGRANPVYEREDAIAMAEAAEGRELSPSEVSSWLTEQSLDYIAEQPRHWLGLMFRKTALFFNATELADTEDLYTYAESSFVLRGLATLLHFGVLAPLAVLGLVVTGRDWRRNWLYYLLAAAYAGSIIVFYVFGRYRYPIVAFLLLFAAVGISHAPAFWRDASRRARAALVLVLLTAAVACNWPMHSKTEMRALMHTNAGTTLLGRGELEAAELELRKAIALSPGYADAHYNLGTLLKDAGRIDEAMEAYAEAIRHGPKLAAAWENMGALLMTRGEAQAGIDHFRMALRHAPNRAIAWANLGGALCSTGAFEEGIQALRRARQLDPTEEQAGRNLVSAYVHYAGQLAAAGRVPEARQALRSALAEAGPGALPGLVAAIRGRLEALGH